MYKKKINFLDSDSNFSFFFSFRMSKPNCVTDTAIYIYKSLFLAVCTSTYLERIGVYLDPIEYFSDRLSNCSIYYVTFSPYICVPKSRNTNIVYLFKRHIAKQWLAQLPVYLIKDHKVRAYTVLILYYVS